MEQLDKMYDTIGQILVEEIQMYLVNNGKLLKKGGLVESFQYNIKNNDLEILSNEYYEYYVKGRKKFARKVPIAAILKWIKRYRFKIGRGRNARGKFISDNSFAFAIQNAIYKNGIKKKKDAVQIVLDRNERLIGQIIDEEFGEIIDKELEKVFE